MIKINSKVSKDLFDQNGLCTTTIEGATEFCFLLNQETGEWLRKWQVPLVLFRSTLYAAKSTSK